VLSDIRLESEADGPGSSEIEDSTKRRHASLCRHCRTSKLDNSPMDPSGDVQPDGFASDGPFQEAGPASAPTVLEERTRAWMRRRQRPPLTPGKLDLTGKGYRSGEQAPQSHSLAE
jgi:hypothetical protein